MFLVRKTAPAVTAVDLTTVKQHLRISNTASDTWLTSAIALAGEILDGPNGRLRRALATQTWYQYREEFPCDDEWRLPLPPLQSVTAVTYLDLDGTRQTVSAASYNVTTPDGAAGEIELLTGYSWPADVLDRDDAVRVEFVCGYGAASDVPAPIRHAMLLIISDLFANRGDEAGESKVALSGAALVTAAGVATDSLLSRYLWREVA